MKDAVRAVWEPFTRRLEGRAGWMYLDSLGFVNTGSGTGIDASRSPWRPPDEFDRARSHEIARGLAWQVGERGGFATDAEIGAEWDRVKSRMDLARSGEGDFAGVTMLRLSEDALDRLLFDELDELEGALLRRAQFAWFESWPADAQLGLLSMAWGVGSRFLFPRFQRAVADRKWTTASEECRLNPDLGALALRNDFNQQLFRNAAIVEGTGLDPEALLFTVV